MGVELPKQIKMEALVNVIVTANLATHRLQINGSVAANPKPQVNGGLNIEHHKIERSHFQAKDIRSKLLGATGVNQGPNEALGLPEVMVNGHALFVDSKLNRLSSLKLNIHTVRINKQQRTSFNSYAILLGSRTRMEAIARKLFIKFNKLLRVFPKKIPVF